MRRRSWYALVLVSLSGCVSTQGTLSEYRIGDSPRVSAREAPAVMADRIAALAVTESGERPKQPPKLLRGSPPPTPIAAMQQGLTGTVTVQFVVAETGFVESVKVLQSSHQVLSDAAVNAVSRWQFAPCIEGNKAVKVTARQTFVFELE